MKSLPGGSNLLFQLGHYAGDQFLGVVDGFRDDLDIHRRLTRLSRALAIDTVLTDQYKGICKNIQSHRETSPWNSHHEFVLFQLVPYGPDRRSSSSILAVCVFPGGRLRASARWNCSVRCSKAIAGVVPTT